MSDLVGNPEDRFSRVAAHFWRWTTAFVYKIGIFQDLKCVLRFEKLRAQAHEAQKMHFCTYPCMRSKTLDFCREISILMGHRSFQINDRSERRIIKLSLAVELSIYVYICG